MTFIGAFREASEGKRIRRGGWPEGITLEALVIDLKSFRLFRSPERRILGLVWKGEFSPMLEDVEATDWEVTK
jgi:hypothetical protein